MAGTNGRSRFDVLFELGRGGMGHADLALAKGLGGFERLVVIKRIKPELAQDQRAVIRFMDEARVAASIHHANVVSTHDVDADEAGPYLVVDYVEGATLEELVDRSLLRGNPLPIAICLRVALDVLSGLAAVHGAVDSRGRPLNILHRDVSPQNVLVGRDGISRLLDFGVAKSEVSAAFTEEGYVVGKLAYLPPEYLRREPGTPAMDIYALGVTLWSALAGREPWPTDSEARAMYAILNEGVPPLSGVREVEPPLSELIARACDLQAERRFESAQAMADEIERIAREMRSLASHRRVAEFVEELLGRDLGRRREHVANLLAQRGVRVADRETGRVEPTIPPPAPRRAHFRVVLAIGGLLTLGLLSALAAYRASPREPTAAASAPSPGPSAAATPDAVVSAPVEASPPPPPAAATSASAAPRPARPAAAARSSASGVKAPPAPRAPDGIVDKNPYGAQKR